MNQKIVIQDSDLHCGKKWDKPNKATEWIKNQKLNNFYSIDFFVISSNIVHIRTILNEIWKTSLKYSPLKKQYLPKKIYIK